MKTLPILLCLLPLNACGADDGSTSLDPSPSSSVTSELFETDDAVYELGDRLDGAGRWVNVEVIFDESSSYLTPSSPNTSWIVDRAVAHSQERPLLSSQVIPLGLYVRRCKGGAWVNTDTTLFAPQSELLQSTFDGQYVVAHFYGNIQTNVLLDDEFECETESPSYATVVSNGHEKDVQRVGRVEFAYVVEHRE